MIITVFLSPPIWLSMSLLTFVLFDRLETRYRDSYQNIKIPDPSLL